MPDLAVPVDFRLPETSCSQVTANKIDLLFAIDNSRSMEPMQSELVARMPQFLKVLFDLAARGSAVDLHLGVITSDYGAGAVGSGGCDPSGGGQGGRLQGVGLGADPGCQAPVGANYVQYKFGPNGANNLPPNQDLATTFACMASVGASGCGMEHQLEATYAALHLKANEGFVRDDALLVIVFLTNEDDCSVPADSDLFDDANGLKYGFPSSYQCTRYGVVCGDPPVLAPYASSGGLLTNCRPAPNPNGNGPGKLMDVSRYIDYFTRPKAMGGLKDDPGQLVLVGIDAPSDPFEVILTNPSQPRDGRDYAICARLNDQREPWCVPTLQVSCHNPKTTTFFADPAVRLNTVINSARNHAVMPICDDDYSTSLQAIANLAIEHISECCLPATIPDVQRPSCAVFETRTINGAAVERAVPDCLNHPGTFPCWRLELKQTCAGGSPQSLGVSIDRNGMPAPPGATIRATCDASP